MATRQNASNRPSITSRLELTATPSVALNFSPAASTVVTAADTADLRPETTNKFTWMAWLYIYKTNVNVLPRIVEKAGTFFCIMGDQTNARRNQLALEVLGNDSNTTEYWGTTRLMPHRWYHVATVFNDSTAQHYINGVAESMTTLLGPYVSPLKTTAATTFKIGNSSAGTRNAPGSLAQVRVFNRDLSASEVAGVLLGTIPSGQVAYYRMNDGSGTSIAEGVNGYTGTSANGPAWQTYTNSRNVASNRTAV